jgi:hypothetical protein
VALEEADALVMVVDARTELARPDYDLARLLQRGGKPLFLAVNKVEGEALANEAENFRRLGISEVFAGELGTRARRRRVAGCDCGGDSGKRKCESASESAGPAQEREIEEASRTRWKKADL